MKNKDSGQLLMVVICACAGAVLYYWLEPLGIWVLLIGAGFFFKER